MNEKEAGNGPSLKNHTSFLPFSWRALAGLSLDLFFRLTLSDLAIPGLTQRLHRFRLRGRITGFPLFRDGWTLNLFGQSSGGCLILILGFFIKD